MPVHCFKKLNIKPFGFGKQGVDHFSKVVGINIKNPASFLKTKQYEAFENYKNHFILDNELKSNINRNIQYMKSSGSYRGIQHSLNLPVRGQRTHTNASKRKKKGKDKNQDYE